MCFLLILTAFSGDQHIRYRPWAVQIWRRRGRRDDHRSVAGALYDPVERLAAAGVSHDATHQTVRKRKGKTGHGLERRISERWCPCDVAAESMLDPRFLRRSGRCVSMRYPRGVGKKQSLPSDGSQRRSTRWWSPVYVMRQIVPAVSSATNSAPSAAIASAAGRPHTSARRSPETQKPVAKFS
jgi:hypothetical protein